ncbi:Putative ribonuclease H protein At1g65750 [Linum perenne]
MAAPRDDQGDDGSAWGNKKHGKFSIKSAYALIADIANRPSEELWKVIWRWQGPNRIRHFLWLAGNDRLPTNDQRTRRNFASDPMCPRCPGQVENSIHVLRDCSFAREVWVATRACAWAKTVADAMERDARSNADPLIRRRVDIAWNPGRSGWWTINSDGAVSLSSGRASAGGLTRDEFGHYVAAFTMNIGRFSITRAELRGAIKGLQIAWEQGLTKVELQVYSSTIIQLVEEEGEPRHQHAMEVLEFRDIFARDWDVRLRHV